MFDTITMIDYQRPLAARLAARKVCGPYRWTPSAPDTGRGFYQASKGLTVDQRGSTFDLRLDYAHMFIPSSRAYRLPLAYHCDAFGDVTMTPIVARLPHGRGFLAGWTMGEGMLANLDAHIWADSEDAARAAFDLAESDAEREREAAEMDEEEEDA